MQVLTEGDVAPDNFFCLASEPPVLSIALRFMLALLLFNLMPPYLRIGALILSCLSACLLE